MRAALPRLGTSLRIRVHAIMGLACTFHKNLAWLIAKTCFAFKTVHRERIIEESCAILAMNHQSYPSRARRCSHLRAAES